jgi:hypothetical protein
MDPHTIDLHHFAERVVVINLKRRPDRLAKFMVEIDKYGPWPFKKPEVVQAVDGHVVPVPSTWTTGGGSYGCSRSHQRIFEDAMADGTKTVLVLEDDAALYPDFLEQITAFLKVVPADWDQIMLGGQHRRGTQPVKPGVVKCMGCQRTHAYLIKNGPLMRELYTRWVEGSVHCDWIMEEVQAKYNVYAPEKFIVAQDASKSDINGKFNPRKSWNAPSGDEPTILLKAPLAVVKALRHYGCHTGFNRCPTTDIDNGLIKIFQKDYGRRQELRRWISDLHGECAAMAEPTITTVWHPDADEGLVRLSCTGELHVIEADTLEEALAQLPEPLRVVAADKPAVPSGKVIVLKAPRPVAHELRGKGWHGGYSRDPMTDIDTGLLDIFDYTDKKEITRRLGEWIELVQGEVETIQNGVTTVWHPMATADIVRASTTRQVVEIVATTADDALQQWERAK